MTALAHEPAAIGEHKRIRQKLRGVVIELVPGSWAGATFIRSTLFRLIDNAPPAAIDVMVAKIRELVDDPPRPQVGYNDEAAS